MACALRSDLQPWVDLADRIGQVQASALGKAQLEKVIITFQGAKLSDSTVTSTLKSAVLRGLFQVVRSCGAAVVVSCVCACGVCCVALPLRLCWKCHASLRCALCAAEPVRRCELG